jgi:uncharacterized protein
MPVTVETLGPAPLDPAATQHMVPMRDGVNLATDVYLPDGPGPFAAVLVRLPYDKNGRYCFMPFIARHVIARGYAFVPQDVRGKFRSEGEALAFVNEVPDAYDSIEWIAQQPWSNGDVGMWGDSYYGFTQWAAVAARHPALKAIVPRVTIADIDGWLEGVTPLYGAHYLAEFWTDANTNEWPVDWSRRPLAGVFDEAFAAIGRRSASFDYVLERSRGGARSELFPPGSHPLEVLRIPTLHGVGWFDNISPSHMLDYEALVRKPETAPFQYLHAGSTDHENYQLEGVPIPESADHDKHDDALERTLPSYIGPALDFFDAFLTGRTPSADVPRVRWHLPHVGRVRAAPPPRRRRAGGRRRRGRIAARRAGRGRAGDVDPRSLAPGAVDDREPLRAALRVSGRERGRGAARRDDVHRRGGGFPADARGACRRPPRREQRCGLAVPARQACRRAPGRPRTRAALRPSRTRCRLGRAGRGVPRPHGLPRRARPSPAAARRDERLPGLPPPPRQRRESVGRDDDAHEPADARHRRR